MKKSHVLVLLQFVLLALLLASFALFPFGTSRGLRTAGALLVLCGAAIAGLALATFAVANKTIPNISPEPTRAAGLVERGVYGHIRHPIYTGVVLSAFGAALVHGHGVSVLLAVMLYGFFEYKARYEERLLSAAYPQYPAYMTRTGRLLPRLRR